MKIKKMISALIASAIVISAIPSFADELYKESFSEKDFTKTADAIVFETEVEDGDYIVNVKTGGKDETKANIYINGGERVRAYTLEAGKTQENVQSVIPKDGKITVEVKGENPNVSAIDITEVAPREKADKPTVYIAGDSTAQTYNYKKVYPQTGWGQVFDRCFDSEKVKIENRSMGGRSLKSYNNDGRLDKILTEMHPGDYVLIQFGINDGNVNKPERYISVEDYKQLMKDKYIAEVQKRGGTPILLTASAASWWDEEKNEFMESRQDYAVPTIEVAKETGVTLLDINKVMTDTWNKLGKDEVFRLYFICEPLESKAYPAGTDDHTHLKEAGAVAVADMVADALSAEVDEIAQCLKPEVKFSDIEGHWGEKDIAALAAENVIDGVSDDKFEPEREVTRAEFLKIAMNAAGIVGHAYRENECLDASEDDWSCYYLQGALDKDIIPEAMIENCKAEKATKTLAEATEEKEAVTAQVNVYGGKFNGNKPISREEMTVIAMNCLSYALKNAKNPVEIKDLATDNEAAGFIDSDVFEGYINTVEAAYSIGLVQGRGNATFAPKASLTRAESAAIAVRMMELLK